MIRLLAIALCVAMLATATPIFAVAENVLLSEVEFINADITPVVGEKAGDHLSFELPADAPYTCKYHYWYNDSKGFRLEEDDIFEEGDYYSLAWSVAPNEGYAFVYRARALINGSAENVDEDNTWIIEDQGIAWTKSATAAPQTKIFEIGLKDVNITPLVGEQVGDYLSYILPAGAQYTCTEHYWYNNSDNILLTSDDVFEKEKSYSLVWTLVPNEGYTFVDEAKIWLNGDEANINDENTSVAESQCIIWTSPIYATVLTTPIDKMDIIDADITPTAGKNAGSHLSYTLPDDAQYTCTEHYWYNETYEFALGENDTFVEGNLYSLKWVLVPNEGYAFTDNATVLFNNGSDWIIDESKTIVNDNQCIVWTLPIRSVLVPEAIQEVNITDAELTPVIGESIYDYMGYTVPREAHYQRESRAENAWANEDYYNKFVEGETYNRQMTLVAFEGYVFDENTIIIVNGEVFSSGIQGSQLLIYDEGKHLTINMPGTQPIQPTMISEINLTGIDVIPITGKQAGELLYIPLPENCGYTVSLSYWSSNGSKMDTNDTFVEEKEYYLFIRLRANRGYSFDSSVFPSINGSIDAVDSKLSGWRSGKEFDIRTKSRHPQPTSDLKSGLHLMVGKTWVNIQNASDILRDGRVYYDDETKTLTLNNATIFDCQYVGNAQAYCSIYADQYITINLAGSNLVYQGIGTLNKSCCGILVEGSGECPPLLTGNGGLSVYSSDTMNGNSMAIYEASENMEIASTGHIFLETGVCGQAGNSNPISCLESVLFSGFNEEQNLTFVSAKEINTECKFPCEVTAFLLPLYEEEEVKASAECFETEDGFTYFHSGEGYSSVRFSMFDYIISTIKINGFCEPIIDGKAGDYINLTIPEGSHYHFVEEDSCWYNSSTLMDLNDDDTFKENTSYELGCTLEADEGYTFDNNPTIILNGGKFGFDKEYTYINNFDVRYFYIFGESKASVVKSGESDSDNLPGDLNNDSFIDMKDVLMIRKYIAKIDVECNEQNADVNGDDFIDMKDVLLLRKFVAGVVDKLGV